MNMPRGWGPLFETIHSGAMGLRGVGANVFVKYLLIIIIQGAGLRSH